MKLLWPKYKELQELLWSILKNLKGKYQILMLELRPKILKFARHVSTFFLSALWLLTAVISVGYRKFVKYVFPDDLREKYRVLVFKLRPELLKFAKHVSVFFSSALSLSIAVISSGYKKFVKYVFIFSLSALSLSIAVISAGYWYMFKYAGCIPIHSWSGCLTDDLGAPLDLERLRFSNFRKASYIYGNNNEKIGMIFYEIRDVVRIDEVPKLMKDAFIATEDKRFYEHRGIDMTAIISAGFGNISRKYGLNIWKRSGGASTITQQLARLEYADVVSDFHERTPTLERKIKEARLAIQLEKRFSKDEILEHFLNRIYLGHGANGVAAAYYRYWGKDIRKDNPTIREVAILAALNKSSTTYDPISREQNGLEIRPDIPIEEADKLKEEYRIKLRSEGARQAVKLDRYNFVLAQMLKISAITEEEYETNRFEMEQVGEISNEKLAQLKPWKDPTYGYSNRLVKEFLMSNGYTESDLSQYGGLRIYTTINKEIQDIASGEFEKHLELINEGLAEENKINGAFVIMEVATGNILALSGGNNFDETQYNRVMASRSPGSGFKPFTYAAAMENYQKDFFDKICNCSFRRRGANGKIWAPQNFREDNPVPYGYIDLATGLIRSINLATLNLAMSLPDGPLSVVRISNKMGVHGIPGVIKDSDGKVWFRRPGYSEHGNGLVPLLPTVIGASETNMLELANAYAVFFRNGIYLPPTLVKEVRDTYGNEILFRAESPVGKRVLLEETAVKMTALMRAVTKIGTSKISMRNVEQQVACKTGTSDGPKDVSIWCGTPEMVVAFRFGNDDFSKIIDLPIYMRKISKLPNMQVTGGWVAGPLARKIIDRIYENREKVEFSEEIERNLEKLLQR